MNSEFYRAFEEKHRGSRELIRSRLNVYRPFIEPLVGLYDEAEAVDLGCGRGEWLELLNEVGFNAHGVDLDEGMLAACHDLGLKVSRYDAIEFLMELPDASQVVVSGFHVAEHIKFSELQVLVQEALRVLKPAGLLILETPNPENIVVGSSNFYVDPTHQRPIPPQLLSFLPEFYGFEKVKLMRLQDCVELASSGAPTLLDVLSGVSPDYAIVAQKNGPATLLAETSLGFDSEYGLTLGALTSMYDEKVAVHVEKAESRVTQAEVRAVQAEVRAAQAEVRAAQAEAQTAQAEARASQAEARASQAEAQASQAEARATQAEEGGQKIEVRATEYEAYASALLASTSWRITAPLRALKVANQDVSHVLRLVKSKVAARIKVFLQYAKLYVNARPRLKHLLLVLLRRLPGLYSRLRFAVMENVVSCDSQPAVVSATEFSELNPQARKVYVDLKTAIDRKQKGSG